MSSSIRSILLVGGLVLFAAGLVALYQSGRNSVPLLIPLEKNEGRLVAAIVPVPKTSVTPTPSPSPDETPTPTPTASPTETATPVINPTPGFSPSPRPTRSPRPTPTPTPVIEPTPTPTPRQTPTPRVTPTPRYTPTPRPTPRYTPTPRPTPRYTPTPLPTPRYTPTPRPTPRYTPTPRPTPKPTPKPTPRRPPVIGPTGPGILVQPTPKPPVILKQTPKPRVIGELREERGEPAATGFWESIGNFFGYISPSAAAQTTQTGGVERETIDLSYPTELRAKGSGTIELKLSHNGAIPGSQNGGAQNGNVKITDAGIELETDRCPPNSALSTCLPDHETRVAVSLVGSGFEITSDGAQNAPKRIGAGSSPTWRWSIRPKGDVEGAQEMFLTLNFTWVKGGETLGPDASRPRDFRISVVKAFFEWGTISIAGLILSLIGPILTLPWFYERGKEVVRYYRERGLKKADNNDP